jgi:predicted Zn-dependent protease
MRLGRLEEATVALRRATELQPLSPHGWYQLAHVHAALCQPEEARQIIEHLQSFEPQVAAQLQRETASAALPLAA